MPHDTIRDDDGGLARLEVDPEHLDNIKTYLGQLADEVNTNLRQYLFDVHRTLTLGGDGRKGSALGSTQIPEVSDINPRLESTFHALDTSLKGFADDFQKAGDAVGKIAEKYRTVEERNAASAADFTLGAAG
jgi:hypothetical protein